MPLYGGVEAGGTKFVCTIAGGPEQILAREQLPTTNPNETIAKTIEFFRKQPYQIAALGVAAFGPVDPHPRSPTFGFITSTPKPGWSNADVVGPLKDALQIPVGFDTDVNGAALGEYRWGAAQGLDTFVYLTIGTGLGGGAYVNGKLLHGLMHPEMGHMLVRHDWEKDPFPGFCPFHGDCLEGMAAGPAIEKRWGLPGVKLPPDHPAWDLEAHYLALGLVAIITVLCPQKIILGGGVMQQKQLFPLVREKTQAYLNGYLEIPTLLDHIDTYIVPPDLGNNAGVLGAIALAEQAAQDQAN